MILLEGDLASKKGLMTYMKNIQERAFILKWIKLAELQYLYLAVLIQDIDRDIL